MNRLNAPRQRALASASPGPFKPLVLALMCASVTGALAQVLPTGGNVVAGTANISSPSAGVLTVNQSSNRGVIHWSSFSVGEGGVVNFVQPGASSVTLNRVTGGRGVNASVINGRINAPGRVFIINPSGVLFGPSAQVNVGGLVASSLDLAGGTLEQRNAAFMAGGEQFVFDLGESSAASPVVNTGSLTATGTGGSGGLIAMIAPNVVNTGAIRADGGTVAMGAGGRVTLDVGGDGLTKLTVGQGGTSVGALVENRNGSITTNGGRIVLAAAESVDKITGVIVHEGSVLTANSLVHRNGEIMLTSGNGVEVSRSTLQARGEAPASTGGRIEMQGRYVEISSRNSNGIASSFEFVPPVNTSGITPVVDVSGQAGGGSILARSHVAEGFSTSGSVMAGETSSLRADALGAGKGGTVTLDAQTQLRAYGAMSARGGAGGGDGGVIETVAVMQGASTQPSGNLDVAGIRVDASAANGAAGRWQVRGNGLSVVHGSDRGSSSASGSQGGARVQDNDINAALNTGTSVGITAQANGRDGGNVVFGEATSIVRTQTNNPLALTINADGSIASRGQTEIRSDAGALQVAMHAGTQGGNEGINYSGVIRTQGGGVSMQTGGVNEPRGYIDLTDTRMDTTSAQAAAGGAVALRSGQVELNGTTITSGAGNVSILGSDGGVYGVALRQSSSGTGAGTGSSIVTTTGSVSIRGRAQSAEAPAENGGVLIGSNSSITSTGGGTIELTGSHANMGTGVRIAAGQGDAIRSTGNVILRANNDGSADALAIDRGVTAGSMINLRPGEVRADGTAADVVQAPIVLGGGSVGGFSISGEEFARLNAPDVVLGGNRHAGKITVAGAINTQAGLTLQSDGAGGTIALSAPVAAERLGLLASGDITQTNAAPVVAHTLLARSSDGSVLLDRAANNVSDNTLGGSAHQAFRFQDVDALRLGVVSVTGADADSNQASTVTSGRIEADTVFVGTQTGNLTLATDVSSRSGADLVAGALFQNPSGHVIEGAPWRVWSATWEGEARGGLSGSGSTPNLYGCQYGAPCDLSVTPGDNHFIYTQRPTVTVTLNGGSRRPGETNPPLDYTVTGLVNGDTGAGLVGSASTPASTTSRPGTYPVTGSFTSASGYQVNVIPGTLTVVQTPFAPQPEFVRDEPNTYTFDSNLGNPPICFATGPLGGERALQGPDLLAVEWSRVRSRPSITSCIDTERKNGCGDF